MSATRIATRQIVADKDGATVVVLEGARLPADHPIVKANASLFKAAPRRGRKAA